MACPRPTCHGSTHHMQTCTQVRSPHVGRRRVAVKALSAACCCPHATRPSHRGTGTGKSVQGHRVLLPGQQGLCVPSIHTCPEQDARSHDKHHHRALPGALQAPDLMSAHGHTRTPGSLPSRCQVCQPNIKLKGALTSPRAHPQTTGMQGAKQ